MFIMCYLLEREQAYQPLYDGLFITSDLNLDEVLQALNNMNLSLNVCTSFFFPLFFLSFQRNFFAFFDLKIIISIHIKDFFEINCTNMPNLK